MSRYVSTTRKESKLPGIGGLSWNARSARATRASISGSRIRSIPGISPATNRVTSQPSGSTKSTTSGPIPSAAAARVAASSTERSMPRSPVSLPATRSTYVSPSSSTLTLWFVIPPPSTSKRASAPGPDALDRSLELAHARILSPFGSKSGSSAISPATHSPKISTATSVPGSCSAGT